MAVALVAPSAAAAASATFDGASELGTTVFFSTDEQLTATDTDSSIDSYQRSGGVTTQVSRGAMNGNGASDVLWIGSSNDGTVVFFLSDEQLAGTDTDSSRDVYQRSGGVTTQVSQGAINGDGAAAAEFRGSSSDGTKVFFSTSEKLAGTDGDSSQDVYQRSGGVTTQVSQGAINGDGADSVGWGGASSDGSKVFFYTAEKLAGTDGDSKIDVYQRSGGVTTQVSQGAINGDGAIDSFFRAISSDGSKVFFQTTEKLAGTDTDSQVDFYERSGGATTQVTTNTAGTANDAVDAAFDGASSDGAKVFFHTVEQMAGTDSDATADVFERAGGTTTQLSTNSAGTANDAVDAAFDGASSDGSKVFFHTAEKLAGTDTDSSTDVFERSGGTTTQVSTNTLETANGASGAVFDGVSSDGSRVVFETDEQLVAGDTDAKVDLYQRLAGATAQVSTNTAGNAQSTIVPSFSGVSSDGAKVFFETDERLADNDSDSQADVYERSGGSTTLVSGEAKPPDTTIGSGPPGRTADRTPTFSFSANEPSLFACRIDAAAFAPCSSPFTTGPLADGSHTFQVRATDIASNTDPIPASRSFKVDTKPPNTSITKLAVDSAQHRATVRFKGTDPAPTSLPLHFQCKLDAKPFKDCGSPKTYKNLKVGTHRFRVKARDALGHVDLSPAVKSIKIKP